ncbi:MAG: insulinase family protein [Proteobacteria bacterium]|nr:insulinase family protein [Pseudomonadota bacterium]MBU1688170.1 insulinase family protein [Pseudomonadota bacterium]
MNHAKAIELAPNLHKTTLDNGLGLLVKETPGTKVATVQIWIKAGSVYEEPNEGGITHLIEHMIFKGTPTRKAGALAEAIEEAGGRINAYTYYEYTVYHATLSSRSWDLALDVLTDAVLNSTFDSEELEREKKVVLEEISMRDDRPQVKLYQEMMSHSYSTHPYRLPIIGTRESVSSFTRDDILSYVKKHYTPENMTVVVVGDVRFSQVYSRVKGLMGDMPSSNYTPPILTSEPKRETPQFFSLAEDIKQTHLIMSFPITAFKDPDSAVLDVIATLLGQGETSRLYNQLRNEKGLVYRISAGAFTPRDPGLFEVSATLDNDKIKETLAAALQEIFQLKYLPVDDEELARVKRNLESDFVFGLERVEGQARILGSFEFLAGDPREDDYLARIRSVSQEDIIRVAMTYFSGNRLITGMIIPKDAKAALDQADYTRIISEAENMARHGMPTSQVPNAYLSGVHQFKFPNGLRLLVREDQRVETVAIRAIFEGGLRSETEATSGAFAFISELLPKGTSELSYRDLAIKVADMAGIISGFNGKNTFGLKADFLARFLEPGLQLVNDIIRKPAFAPEEAEKIRPELISQLKQQQDSLPSLAFLTFNRALFQGHPYGLNPAGEEAAIQSFSTDQLRKIYQAHIGPEKIVLTVAGAVKAEEVRDLVEKLFSDWSPAEALPTTTGITEETILPPDPPAHPVIIKEVRDREQLHIIIGFLGTTLTDQDRYCLEIIDNVLSGQSGRLFTELRDKRSMAYSLSSFTLLGVDTGSFGIYIGTSPDKRDPVIEALWKELYKVRQEPISAAELDRARNQLIGQYQLGLQTHGAQALEMGLNETYGLGQDFGNRYVKSLEEVTPQQVLNVARKYILPDHYVMVTLGAETSGAPAESTVTEPSSAETPLEMNPEPVLEKIEPQTTPVDNSGGISLEQPGPAVMSATPVIEEEN